MSAEQNDIPGRICASLVNLAEIKGFPKPVLDVKEVRRIGTAVIMETDANGAVYPAEGEKGLEWAERLEAAVERDKSQL